MVVQGCDPSTLQGNTGRPEVQDHLDLHRELKARQATRERDHLNKANQASLRQVLLYRENQQVGDGRVAVIGVKVQFRSPQSRN